MCIATYKLTLVVASEGYSLVMVHELFIAECRMQNASHCILSLQSMQCRHAGFRGCSARGLAALWHVESSQTRDPTHVPYIGSHIPNRWTIREVQDSVDAISMSTFLTQR